jgi:hypothetical protein
MGNSRSNPQRKKAYRISIHVGFRGGPVGALQFAIHFGKPVVISTGQFVLNVALNCFSGIELKILQYVGPCRSAALSNPNLASAEGTN